MSSKVQHNDKVVDVEKYEDLPQSGDPSVTYVTLNNPQAYRWINGAYFEISSKPLKVSSIELLEAELQHYKNLAQSREAEIENMKKQSADAAAALGIVSAANRRVGFAAMAVFVLWLNGFRYVETKWEMFFSLFGYTVYLSLIKTVDWFSNVFTGFFAALIEMMQRSGGPGI